MTLPRLDKLQAKCAELGIEVTQKGKRPAKSDYAGPLRDHFIRQDYGAAGLPYTEVTPMLCFAEWNLKDGERDAIWADQGVKWVAQRKLNGCRAVVHFVAGKGVFVHSRTVSVKTFRYQELTKQLTWFDHVPDFSATVDAEIMCEKSIDTRRYTAKGEVTKTSLHSTTSLLHLEPEAARAVQVEQDAHLKLHVFDIMSMDGEDITKMSLRRRLLQLDRFVSKVTQSEVAPHFEWPEVRYAEKREFFKNIVAEGGEGIILKHLDSPYIASSSRRRDAWVKVKKRLEYDAFVTDFQRGEPGTDWQNLVGALVFSVHTEAGIHEIAKCSNLPLEKRRQITIYDPATDTVKMDPRVYGKVAEVSGQDISARVLRLSHATIDRWRPKAGPDAKTAEQCHTSKADLRAAAEWVGS